MDYVNDVKERPFDFYMGCEEGRIFKKKMFQAPIFPEKNIQDRVNSIVRFVLYANKKTGLCHG